MQNNMEVVSKLAEVESRIQAAERENNEELAEATAANLVREEAETASFVNKENAIKMAE